MSTSDNCVDFAATQSLHFDSTCDWADTAPDMWRSMALGSSACGCDSNYDKAIRYFIRMRKLKQQGTFQTCLPLDMIQIRQLEESFSVPLVEELLRPLHVSAESSGLAAHRLPQGYGDTSKTCPTVSQRLEECEGPRPISRIAHSIGQVGEVGTKKGIL